MCAQICATLDAHARVSDSDKHSTCRWRGQMSVQCPKSEKFSHSLPRHRRSNLSSPSRLFDCSRSCTILQRLSTPAPRRCRAHRWQAIQRRCKDLKSDPGVSGNAMTYSRSFFHNAFQWPRASLQEVNRRSACSRGTTGCENQAPHAAMWRWHGAATCRCSGRRGGTLLPRPAEGTLWRFTNNGYCPRRLR